MMLRFTFENEVAAVRIENAIKKVLAAGYRTGDIYEAGMKRVSCSEMGDQIVAAM
jgi:3-isopropylmalate dehydrogenase